MQCSSSTPFGDLCCSYVACGVAMVAGPSRQVPRHNISPILHHLRITTRAAVINSQQGIGRLFDPDALDLSLLNKGKCTHGDGASLLHTVVMITSCRVDQ